MSARKNQSNSNFGIFLVLTLSSWLLFNLLRVFAKNYTPHICTYFMILGQPKMCTHMSNLR